MRQSNMWGFRSVPSMKAWCRKVGARDGVCVVLNGVRMFVQWDVMGGWWWGKEEGL